MSKWNAVKKTWTMARELRRQRGGWTVRYFADALDCGYRHQASPENYFVLRFFELDNRAREAYLTSGRSSAADRELNRRMTGEERRIMAEKHLFYQCFAGMIRRETLYLPEAGYREFDRFLTGQERIILKPDRGIMGHGVMKLSADKIKDRAALYERGIRERLLAEEVIRQHPELERISPGCVNSVRINMARDRRGVARIIGACLKCGGPGAAADNFHSGGIAYPLDPETGTVTGPGRNLTELSEYQCHPGSGVRMPGFTVPFWKEVRAYVFLAMERMPDIGYVGWDVAVTDTGPELIEGNCHWPGGNIIQFDGIGKYPLIKACLEEV